MSILFSYYKISLSKYFEQSLAEVGFEPVRRGEGLTFFWPTFSKKFNSTYIETGVKITQPLHISYRQPGIHTRTVLKVYRISFFGRPDHFYNCFFDNLIVFTHHPIVGIISAIVFSDHPISFTHHPIVGIISAIVFFNYPIIFTVIQDRFLFPTVSSIAPFAGPSVNFHLYKMK